MLSPKLWKGRSCTRAAPTSCRRSAKRRASVVEAGDDRRAHEHVDPALDGSARVGEDEVVLHARALAVRGRVPVLHVDVGVAEQLRHALEVARGHVRRGLHVGVHVGLAQAPQQLNAEVRPGERLAAGKSDAASALLVEGLVLHALLEDVLHRARAAGHRERATWAARHRGRRLGRACVDGAHVHVVLLVRSRCLRPGARRQARPAANAALLVPLELRRAGLAGSP